MEERELPESKWIISLYEKVGRIYSEVGEFWSDTTDPELPYELFSGLINPTPPRAAIEHASVQPEELNREYEIRLYQNNRVVSSAVWPASVVAMCVEDYKERDTVKVVVQIEVEVDAEDKDDPMAWDLAELAENGLIKILDKVDDTGYDGVIQEKVETNE